MVLWIHLPLKISLNSKPTQTATRKGAPDLHSHSKAVPRIEPLFLYTQVEIKLQRDRVHSLRPLANRPEQRRRLFLPARSRDGSREAASLP